MISQKTPLQILDLFLEEYSNIKNIDSTHREKIKKFIKYMKIRIEDETSIYMTKKEEEIWYKALDKDMYNPDYSVYNSDNYYMEVIGCFIVYSRTYINILNKTKMNNSDITIKEYILSKIDNKSNIIIKKIEEKYGV